MPKPSALTSFSARISRSPNQNLPATNPRQTELPLEDHSCLNPNSVISDSETHSHIVKGYSNAMSPLPITTPAASACISRPGGPGLPSRRSRSKNSLARQSGSAASSKSLEKAMRILLHLEENGLDMALALLASALRLNKTTAVRRNL